MSNVRADSPPPESRILSFVDAGDFIDCFSVRSTCGPRAAATVIVDFPAWVGALMTVRRWVTTPFGLVNDTSEGMDRIGFFPVESETADEIIAGFDDKHLDFRLSIAAVGGRVFLTTWVRRHNLGGRLYLWCILPFHKLIIRNALARLGRTPSEMTRLEEKS